MLIALFCATGAQSGDDTVKLVGQLGGECHTVYLSGRYAYLGEGLNLIILDVLNPTTPSVRGQLAMPREPASIYVSGGVAYVADGGALRLVDVSNPSSPTLRGSYPTWGRCILAAGGSAYVLRSDGLRVLNVSNPSSPTLRGQYATPISDGGISGSTAYLVYGTTLKILNLGNPSAPTLRRSYELPNAGTRLSVSGSRVYVGSNNCLQIVDVSNPSSPTLRSSLNVPAEPPFASGNRCYAAWMSKQGSNPSPGGFRILDVADPGAPRELGLKDGLEGFVDFAVTGNFFYAACGNRGLQILDVSSPPSVPQVGSYTGFGACYDVSVTRDLACLTDGTGRLQIVDVSNPAAPALRGSFDPGLAATAVVASGTLAYVACSSWDTTQPVKAGLAIVDLTDPSSPTTRGFWKAPAGGTSGEGDFYFDVFVSGGLAYVAGWFTGSGISAGLRIVDVSDPSSPTLRGTYAAPYAGGYSYSVSVSVSGNLAFLADAVFWSGNQAEGYLYILDVGNPSAPVLRNTMRRVAPFDVCSSGTTVFATVYRDGGPIFEIIDVANPSAPSRRGYIEIAGEHVFVSGSMAFVTGINGDPSGGNITYGLHAIDISRPDLPRARGYRGFSGASEAAGPLYAIDGTAYIAAGREGLAILRYTPMPPSAPTDLVATPSAWGVVNLNWYDTSLYEDVFIVERRTGSSGEWTWLWNVSASFYPPGWRLRVPYEDRSAPTGPTCYYRVCAFNTSGRSAYTNVTSATIPNAPPAAPSNARLTYPYYPYPSALLQWNDNSNNEQGFLIERKVGATGAWTHDTSAAANQAGIVLNGLPPGGIFSCRVKAYNPRGTSAYSNEAVLNLNSPRPVPPSQLGARALAWNRVVLTWRDNSSDEAGFKIFRQRGSEPWREIYTLGPNVTSFFNTDTWANLPYRYMVCAFVAQDRAYSNEAYVVTPHKPAAARPMWTLYR